MISFSKLDDISSWRAETTETRYCPLTEESYTVSVKVWPTRYLDNYFDLYVN